MISVAGEEAEIDIHLSIRGATPPSPPFWPGVTPSKETRPSSCLCSFSHVLTVAVAMAALILSVPVVVCVDFDSSDCG